jgi:hypothetical protein
MFEFSVKISIRNRYFPPCAKKVKFCFPVKYVNIHVFFTFNLAVTKKTVGDGERLLTYLNSALKVLSGLDLRY